MPQSFESINEKIKKLKKLLNSKNMVVDNNNVKDFLPKLMELKNVIGNVNNDIHFLTSVIANSFLKETHGEEFDFSKPSSSSGPDIETTNIVGEIKTTMPCKKNHFGSNQKKTIIEDLNKLIDSKKQIKYFFVIEDKAKRELLEKYSEHYPSVKIRNLLEKNPRTKSEL